jgi:hypothetical protein
MSEIPSDTVFLMSHDKLVNNFKSKAFVPEPTNFKEKNFERGVETVK